MKPQLRPGDYDPGALAAFYDAYGGREWERLERDIQGRTSYAIHLKLLESERLAGLRVADLGCGPGRFAVELLRAGAEVTLGDISGVQLEAASARIREAGLAAGISASHVLDVCDLSRFEDAAFDAVVCYGGAVSYTREHHMEALAELVRVLRPGGQLFLSVMSLLGTLSLIGTLDAGGFLERMGAHVKPGAISEGSGVVLTVPGSDEFHQPMALFTASYMRGALERVGLLIERLAAANPITRAGQALSRVTASAEATERLLELELAVCEAPGVADMGEHIVIVARKRGA